MLGKAKESEGFKVIQEPAEKTAKVKAPRKSAKAKGISTEEVAAMVTAQVAEIVKDLPVAAAPVDLTEVLEMLTKMQAEIASVSAKLDKLTAKSPTSKKKDEDSRKAKEDAKLKAMADLSSVSDELANIVTQL